MQTMRDHQQAHGRLFPHWLLLGVSLVTACTSPIQPSTPVSSDHIWIDPALQPALRILQSLPRATWAGESIDTWMSHATVTRVEVGDTGEFTAWYRIATGVITVHPRSLQDVTPPRLAAVLAHEWRHAEGYVHTCGPFADATLVEWGPWAVQAAVLRALGLPGDAESIEATFICDPQRTGGRFILADTPDMAFMAQ